MVISRRGFLAENLEKIYSTSVKCLFSDNGTEFNDLRKYADNRGIKVELSSSYTPNENGKAERYNRTVFSVGKAMLVQANLN
eukprot:maker-scaffold_41-snap-gene-2.29-mRNA-1 protein AED:0.54 eAED:0.54 QI:0/0/0/0.5/0/0/2/0/81